MLVYRVEHDASGRGPYRLWSLHGSLVLNSYHTSSNGRGRFQSKRWERMIGTSKSEEYYFGFSSLACLLLWFDSCIEELHNAGCIIRVYNADKRYIIQNFNQLVFNKEKAKIVETLDLLETAKKVYGPIDNPKVPRIIKVTKEDGSIAYETVCYGA